MQDGEDTVLSDILVARAQNGIVNQPWKRFTVSKPAAPSSQTCPPLCRYQQLSSAPALHGTAPWISTHE